MKNKKLIHFKYLKNLIMKNVASKISDSLNHSFDLELLLILNRDLKIQKAKMARKFIETVVANTDIELLNIIKKDAMLIKSQLISSNQNLAQAS